MKKRLLSFFLCLCMALTLLPAAVWAAPAAVTDAAGLKAALAAGGGITLGGDFTVSETLTVDQSVTLDLNGHTLTAAQSVFSLFRVETGGALVIQDSRGGGKLQATEPDPDEMHSSGVNLVYLEAGECWLKGGTLDAGTKGYAATITHTATGASFLMTGGGLEGRTSIFLRGEGNLAVVTGGTITATTHSLYIDGKSHAYIGGDVTTNGNIHNPNGILTVTGGTHNGVLHSGSSYNLVGATIITQIYGGTFHGVSQNTYGDLKLYGGIMEPCETGYFSPNSFKTTQEDKTLADYLGDRVTLDGPVGVATSATVTDAFSLLLPAGCTPEIVGVFGAGHGTVSAGGITLDRTNRLITDGSAVTANATEAGYTGTVDESKDGVVLVVFQPESSVPSAHTHAVSVDCSDTEGDQVEFTAWDKADSLPTDPGNYYLTTDVTFFQDIWVAPSGITTLCLNGHTIKRIHDTHYSSGTAVYIGEGNTLNLCDCSGSGTIAHGLSYDVLGVSGTLRLYGGTVTGGEYGVQVYEGGAFHMHGGGVKEVTYNSSCGVKVREGGTFLMDGGIISGNDHGVFVNAGGTFQAKGNVVVADNTEDNVWLKYTFDHTTTSGGERVDVIIPAVMELSGPLGANARIGLSEWSWREVDEADAPFLAVQGGDGYTITANDLKKLSSDNDEYRLTLKADGKVYFVSRTAHEHDWATAWSKNDTHHWHECTADGCGVTDNAQKDGYAGHTKTWVKTDAAQHWQTCAACGWTGEKTAHVYDSDQDTVCDTCGYTRTVAPPTPTPPGTGFSDNYYTLTAAAGEGGSISPQGKVTVQQGLRKTFTVTPDEGYEIADVLVDGKSVGAVESYVFRQVTRRHTIEAVFRSVEEKDDREESSLPFTDVPQSAWYYDSVKKIYEEGLMDGTGDGLFSPETVTSRAMIAAILWRLESSPESEAPVRFPDCERDTWYASGVAWASEAGVVKGYDTGSFGPDDPITREQLAVMLYRYTQTKGQGFVGSWMFRLDFADAAEVSPWASEAVHWCVMNQILTGKDGNRLDPLGQATRAEAAAVLTRFCQP